MEYLSIQLHKLKLQVLWTPFYCTISFVIISHPASCMLHQYDAINIPCAWDDITSSESSAYWPGSRLGGQRHFPCKYGGERGMCTLK